MDVSIANGVVALPIERASTLRKPIDIHIAFAAPVLDAYGARMIPSCFATCFALFGASIVLLWFLLLGACLTTTLLSSMASREYVWRFLLREMATWRRRGMELH